MRNLLHLAAILALTGATTTHAQITNPDKLVAPAPRPPELHQHPDDKEDLSWLWQYAKPAPTGRKSLLLADPRFAILLKDHLRSPQAFWAGNEPLSDAAATFLAGEGRVIAIDNRYLAITGCVVEQCEQRGILWIDLGTPAPLVVFAAMRWTENGRTPGEANAPFDLWMFSNRNVDSDQVPPALHQVIHNWALTICPDTPRIEFVTIIDIDGTPHLLTAKNFDLAAPTCPTDSTPGTHS